MNICLFGASSERLDACYLEDAYRFGLLLGQNGHCLVFGGSRNGLMGACARGVRESGGETVGIAPRFFEEADVLDPLCSRFIYTETMAQRKSAMEDEAEAFAVLPGGIGTLEEFFEVLTLRQLGRHGKPIVLLNTAGYYDALAAMLAQAAEKGFVSRGVFDKLRLCDSPEEALAALTADPAVSGQGSLMDYWR